MKNPRQLVLELLNSIENKKSYSNIILDDALLTNDLSPKDKSFVSKLFYGTLERKITLDYIIAKYSKSKLNKIETPILNILRIGFYQIMYLDSIEDFAIVNECVELVNSIKRYRLKGFVNAILRNFLRDDKVIDLPNKQEDINKYYSIKYSCSEWIVKLLLDNYNYNDCIDFFEKTFERPPSYIKINNLKISKEDLIINLVSENIHIVSQETLLEDTIEVKNLKNIRGNKFYKLGFFHVQDISSGLCCKILNPKRGDILFDMCAAPGGKSFTLAQMMLNDGIIKSFDIYKNKLDLIRKGSDKLGLNIINPYLNDSTLYDSNLGFADKVLCDVPCSGIGIIRRKPEIKYKTFEEVNSLPEMQYKILLNSSKYLKKDGILIYSTCTLNIEENDRIVEKFLKENSNFVPCIIKEYLPKNMQSFKNGEEYKITVFPNQFNGDGFFIAKLKKVS